MITGFDRGAPVYPIGVATRLTGLSARQIRYYEQSGLLAPTRTEGRHRLYTPADVERLQFVKAKLAEGLSVAGVRALFAESDRPQPSAVTSPAAADSVDFTSVRPAPTQPVTSLYPVRNQAGLIQYLNQTRRPDRDH